MRSVVVWLMLLVIVAEIVLLVALSLHARVFSRRYPVLKSRDDMTAFRRLAKTQMYVSYVALKLAWVPVLIWVVGRLLGWSPRWLDLLWFWLLPQAVAVSLAAIPFLNRPVFGVRQTKVTDAAFQPEFDHVVKVWIEKPLPDW